MASRILLLWVSGLVLMSCNRGADKPELTPDGSRVVSITANDDGFTPSEVTISKGTRTVLRFTRTSDQTCADKVVFPELQLERALPLNTAVDIPLPTEQPRTLTFQCGMGMYKSSVVVR